MRRLIPAVLPALVLCVACVSSEHQNPATDSKQEIADAEKKFETMAAEKGVAEAFWYFADSNAVIKRGNDSLIFGKQAIRNFYSADHFKTASVRWTPDYIDVSGNMAYTYGKYIWQTKGADGLVQEHTGVFH